MFYTFKEINGAMFLDLIERRFNKFDPKYWFDFREFEDLVTFYKCNIIKPNFDTLTNDDEVQPLSKEEQNIILEIWNQYKDLI